MGTKRIIAIVISVLAILAFSSSCRAHIDDVQVDLSTDLNKQIPITRRTRVELVSMDPTKLYAVTTSAFGSSRSLIKESGSTESSGGLLELELGNYLAIPGQDNSCSFTSEEAGVDTRRGYASVVEIRDGGTDDMTIDSKTDPVAYYTDDGSAVYEEYYHIDFSQEPFSSLDRSRMIIEANSTSHCEEGDAITTSQISYGYVTIQDGFLVKQSSATGVMDLSDLESVNLYYSCKYRTNNPTAHFQTKVRMTSPVVCEPDTEYHVEEGKNHFVFYPGQGGGNYVFEVIHKNPEGKYTYPGIELQTVDGKTIEDKYLFDTEGIKTLLVDLDQSILFRISKGAGDDDLSVIVRDATEEELQEYNDSIMVIDADTYEFTLDSIPEGDSNVFNDMLYFKSSDKVTLSGIKITGHVQYEDGTYAVGQDYFETNISDLGTLNGSYFEAYVDEEYLLKHLRINVRESRPFKIRVRVEKAKPILGKDSNEAQIVLVPNNGQPFSRLVVECNSLYTVPELENGDKTFRGFLYWNSVFKPGEQIFVNGRYNTLLALWE